MPAELHIAGIVLPTLIPLALVAAALTWVLDSGLGRLRAYRYVWHPALFRVAIGTLLFSLLGLLTFTG